MVFLRTTSISGRTTTSAPAGSRVSHLRMTADGARGDGYRSSSRIATLPTDLRRRTEPDSCQCVYQSGLSAPWEGGHIRPHYDRRRLRPPSTTTRLSDTEDLASDTCRSRWGRAFLRPPTGARIILRPRVLVIIGRHALVIVKSPLCSNSRLGHPSPSQTSHRVTISRASPPRASRHEACPTMDQRAEWADSPNSKDREQAGGKTRGRHELITEPSERVRRVLHIVF